MKKKGHSFTVQTQQKFIKIGEATGVYRKQNYLEIQILLSCVGIGHEKNISVKTEESSWGTEERKLRSSV